MFALALITLAVWIVLVFLLVVRRPKVMRIVMACASAYFMFYLVYGIWIAVQG